MLFVPLANSAFSVKESIINFIVCALISVLGQFCMSWWNCSSMGTESVGSFLILDTAHKNC